MYWSELDGARFAGRISLGVSFAELDGGAGDTSHGSDEAPWWPPTKIAGRYLAPFLAERAETILATIP